MKRIYDLVEEKIQEAIRNGDFDNLSTKGKPIDLRAWRNTPAHLRMGYSVLKNAGIAPVEVDMKKELARLEEAVAQETDPEEKMRLANKLNDLQITYSLKLEKLRKSE